MTMRDFASDHSALALNTATLGHNLDGHGAGWVPQRVVDECAARGYGGITFWRREFGEGAAALKLADEVATQVRGTGMQVAGLCRTPFITGPLAPKPQSAMIDDFKASIELAGALGAPCLVIVCGGIIEGSHSIDESLKRVAEVTAEMAPLASKAGTTLALEPLNPVYGGNRSCLVRVADAVDMCEMINHPAVRIAVDVYHVWWDRSLGHELKRAGANRIAGYHLCDWLADTTDVLLDRGMMGDGVADLKHIRQAVEAAGYQGLCEVEIFSAQNWWKRDPGEVLDVCIQRFRDVC